MRNRIGEGRLALALGAGLIALAACGRSGDEPLPVPGFGVLSGQRVLVLPVQYVRPMPGGWVGGASNAQAAARQADLEIAFALGELGGRATWVTPDQQIEALRRRPSIRVNPYAFSADELRQKAEKLKDVRDPLYGEIRLLAALFDSRYAVWPLELVYAPEEESTGGRLAIRTFLLDVRAGTVMWYGLIRGDEQPPASPGALAAAAQAFALQVSP
ncbi:MAG: hypothetical protein JSV41_10885 [Gemmatimonadota bacterium]|nr:MAG: hypothetical protein JSV41_10885 [Gemmatimonadota bacterium]